MWRLENEGALWQGDSTESDRKWRGRSPIWQEDTSTLPLSRSPRGLFSVISCLTEKRRIRKVIIHIRYMSLLQWTQTSHEGCRCPNFTFLIYKFEVVAVWPSQFCRAPPPMDWSPPRSLRETTAAFSLHSHPSTWEKGDKRCVEKRGGCGFLNIYNPVVLNWRQRWVDTLIISCVVALSWAFTLSTCTNRICLNG